MRTYNCLINRYNLPYNGVFVFGANPIGINGNVLKGTGGAALVASMEFGVEKGEKMNNCISKSGKAYGLVTVRAPKKFLPNNLIRQNISIFYNFAAENPKKLFYVAYDGINPNLVSLNGKTRKELAKLFYESGDIPNNVIFEENFCKLILSNTIKDIGGFKI